jgi:integrase
MPLTDIKCRKAAAKDKPYKLSDGKGMYLEIRPNGSKYWRYKYRFNNKEKLLALGVYPETPLSEAREALMIARKQLRDGLDPSQERKKKKALTQQSADNTFEVVARDWFENRKSRWKKRYAEEIITRLEKDIFPEIGSYPILEIEPPLLLQVIRKIESRGAHELAKRQLQKCGEIFRYGIAIGKAIRDPSADIKEALKPVKKTHYAAIDVKELPEFLKALQKNDARLYQSTRNALQLIMLTFVRTSELINASWEEIDFENKEWVIPAERMKMGKEHIVPLSRQAVEILQNQKILAGHWPLVFPSNVRPRNSISNNTILGALKRMGYQGRMTGHGFRALAMSAIKQELGYRHEVVDRQLAHVPANKIDKAYDRAMFLEERKIMMQEWADYLDRI